MFIQELLTPWDTCSQKEIECHAADNKKGLSCVLP